MVTSSRSLFESEVEKYPTHVVEVDIRVGSPAEKVGHQLRAPRHAVRLSPERAVREPPNEFKLTGLAPHARKFSTRGPAGCGAKSGAA